MFEEVEGRRLEAGVSGSGRSSSSTRTRSFSAAIESYNIQFNAVTRQLNHDYSVVEDINSQIDIVRSRENMQEASMRILFADMNNLLEITPENGTGLITYVTKTTKHYYRNCGALCG